METHERQIDVLARTIYGEARGELYGGRVAVGCVVRNRVRFDLWGDAKPDWWGEGYEGVCWKPSQFSCWNEGDPNHALVRGASASERNFRECLSIAEDIVMDGIADITFGSTHYHTVEADPIWGIGKTPVVKIGKHFFYNDIEKGVRT